MAELDSLTGPSTDLACLSLLHSLTEFKPLVPLSYEENGGNSTHPAVPYTIYTSLIGRS